MSRAKRSSEEAGLCTASFMGVEDEDPGERLRRQRIARANCTLRALGQVHNANHQEGVLQVHPEFGDGFCFFRAVLSEIGLSDIVSSLDFYRWTFLSLIKTCEYNAIMGADEYLPQRRQHLSTIVSLRALLGDNFQNTLSSRVVYLLDVFHAWYRGDMSGEQHYCDVFVLNEFLRLTNLKLLVVEYDDITASRSFPHDEAYAPQTGLNGADIVVVHYLDGAYVHYDSVQWHPGENNRAISWQILAQKRDQILANFCAADVMWSYFQLPHDEAVAHVLSYLQLHPPGAAEHHSDDDSSTTSQDSASNSEHGSSLSEFPSGSDYSDVCHVSFDDTLPSRPWDRTMEVVVYLATHLRVHPTLPCEPSDNMTYRREVMDGILWPLVHCAFSGCSWVGEEEEHLQAHVR